MYVHDFDQREQPWTGGVCVFACMVSFVWTQLREREDRLAGFKPGRSVAMPELVKCMVIYPCLTTFCYRSAKGLSRQGLHIKPSEPFRCNAIIFPHQSKRRIVYQITNQSDTG